MVIRGAAGWRRAACAGLVAIVLAACTSGGPDGRTLGPAPTSTRPGPAGVVTPDGRWGSRSREVCEGVLPVATVVAATSLEVELLAQTPEEAGVAPDDVVWDVLCTYAEPGAHEPGPDSTPPVILDLEDGGSDTRTVEPGPMTDTVEVDGLPGLLLEDSVLSIMGPRRTATLHLSLPDAGGAPAFRTSALAMGEVVADSLR